MDSRRFRTLFSLSLAVMDVAMTALAFIVAHRLRVLIPWPAEAVEIQRFRAYGGVLVIHVVSVLFVFFLFRMYHLVRATSRVDLFYAIFGGLTVATLLSVALSVLLLKNSVFEVNLPRVMVFYAWAGGVLLVTLGRWALQQIRAALQTQGGAQDKVILIGTGEVARLVIQKIHSQPRPEQSRGVEGYPVLGQTEDLPRLMDQYGVDEVIIATPEAPDEEMVQLISLCYREGVSIKVFPDVFELMAAGVTIDDLGGLPLLNVRDVALRGWKLTFKRAMDLVGSAIGLVLLSPLMMLIALLIKLDSPGPVIYVQERMGLDAKPFPVFKFRSMRADAEVNGPGWTVKDDPRVTRLGRFIRKYSIDELPQLINVLLGDMSLVGPRPEQPAFVEQFQQMIPRYMERHREKAGLTGWAQVNGLRGDTSIMERTKYDLWYIENWSVWLDIKIIVRTLVRGIFFDRSAY
ncbi:MAG: putative glycosyltransferase [Anaerolineales bacterium]|nr:putative glycosyltransferase [Anaerolineales bacterium]